MSLAGFFLRFSIALDFFFFNSIYNQAEKATEVIRTS